MAYTSLSSLLDAIQSPKPIKASTHRSMAQNIDALSKAEEAAFQPATVGNYAVVFLEKTDDESGADNNLICDITAYTPRGGVFRCGGSGHGTETASVQVWLNGVSQLSTNGNKYIDITAEFGDKLRVRASYSTGSIGSLRTVLAFVACSNPLGEAREIDLTGYTDETP